MIEKIYKAIIYFLLILSLSSCDNIKKESNIYWANNNRFLQITNGQIITGDRKDTITCENNIVVSNDESFTIIKFEGDYRYLINKNGEVAVFGDKIYFEKFDKFKIKHTYLIKKYDKNEHIKSTAFYHEFNFKNDSSLTIMIKNKAKQNNLTFEEQVAKDVKYLTNKLGLINFQEDRINYFINNFLNKKELNEFILKKSISSGFSVEQMIILDSKWLLEKEIKLK